MNKRSTNVKHPKTRILSKPTGRKMLIVGGSVGRS